MHSAGLCWIHFSLSQGTPARLTGYGFEPARNPDEFVLSAMTMGSDVLLEGSPTHSND